MQVFINLQGFVASLLPAVGPAAFRPWAYTFTLRMVAASGRLPQLSGFYHLITTAMQLSEAAGLLNKAHHLPCLPTCRTAHRETLVNPAEAALNATCFIRLFINMQEVESNAADGARLVVMLSAYLRDLLTASRQYSDELLAAALKLLLSAPVSVLPPQVWRQSPQKHLFWHPICE